MLVLLRLFFLFPLVFGVLWGSAVAGFSQPSQVPGLVLHLDASRLDSLTLGEEESVLEWRDSVRNDIVFSPSSFSNGTVRFVPDAINGRSAIRFDGAFLATLSSAALEMTNDVSGITVIAVGWNTGDGSQTYLRIGEGTSVNSLRLMLGRQTSQHRFLARRVDGGPFQTVAGGERIYEEWGIDSGVADFENRMAALYINGAEIARSDTFLDSGTTSPSDSLMFRIGTDHADQFWQGDIAEILIYNRALSTQERKTVELYLVDKYDLPYAGTPSNPEAVPLKIGRALEVKFDTVEGATYEILCSGDGREWTPALDFPKTGNGRMVTAHLPADTQDAMLRVVEMLPEVHVPDAGGIPTVPQVDGLRLHLDASDSRRMVLDSTATHLVEWRNGDNIVFSPPDPNSRPTFETGVVNGQPVVRFGQGRFLEASSPAALSITNEISGVTVFAVARDTGSGSQNLIRIGTGGSMNSLRFMLGRRGNEHRILGRRTDNGAFQELAGGQRAYNEWGIDSGYVDFVNGTAALQINGVEVASASFFLTPGMSSPTDSRMFRIGNDHSTQFWQGDIAEILLFDRILFEEERNEIGIYLSNKYRIPHTITKNTDIGFETRLVADLSFYTGVGSLYQLEMSEDLIDWKALNGEIEGTGFPVSVGVPFGTRERAFFRGSRLYEGSPGMKHVGVYYKDGDFAAWPANHGIWSWGNEILVGFQAARHRDSGAHTWDSTTSLHKFARSLDGGVTWTIEDAFEQGITAAATGHRLGERAIEPVELSAEIDFHHPDFAFTFRRATDRAGPSCFYYSYDRGKSWEGPFKFPNLDTAGVATRTDYIVEGKHRMLAFLTTAKSNGEIGRTACARTMDGGKTWERVSWIGPEPEGQAIMPATVGLSPSRILAVLRQTGAGSQSGANEWLSGYLSEDNGATWERQVDPADGLGWNSNPPALIQLEDGRLCLIYGVRGSPSRLVARFSADEGKTWSEEIVLRGQDGANRDMGYVRAVQRPDGKVVAVYYYNHALSNDRPPYRYIAATIFDPTEKRQER